MFFASNICCVSSGTVTARYCWLPRAVRGAKPVMKKCRRGKGTVDDVVIQVGGHTKIESHTPMLTASLRKSEFSWPGKRRQVVIPDMTMDTRWFRSPYVGVESLRVRKQMS